MTTKVQGSAHRSCAYCSSLNSRSALPSKCSLVTPQKWLLERTGKGLFFWGGGLEATWPTFMLWGKSMKVRLSDTPKPYSSFAHPSLCKCKNTTRLCSKQFILLFFLSDKHIDFWTTVEDGNLSQTYLFENTNIKLYFPHLWCERLPST